jgi:hypothetical protein
MKLEPIKNGKKVLETEMALFQQEDYLMQKLLTLTY